MDLQILSFAGSNFIPSDTTKARLQIYKKRRKGDYRIDNDK